MTHQPIPASGQEENAFPRLRTGRNSAWTADLGKDFSVRPGESDSTRMLSAVLLLAIATIIIALALLWWLT